MGTSFILFFILFFLSCFEYDTNFYDEFCLLDKECNLENEMRHYSSGHCVSCIKCENGIWIEMDCAEYPFKEDL